MRRNVKPTAIKEIENVEAKLPLVSFIDRTGACGSTEVKSLKWQIKVQEIRLSDYIVSLIRNIRNSYLEIIKDDNDLKRRLCTFSVVDDFELLNLPQQKLMDWIKESGGGRITNSFHKNETFVTLVALYVIKQMASYLCFYGIDIAYLYIEYISKSFKWLRHKLSLLQSLVEEAHVRIMNDISKSHPSLSAIEEILGSTTSQSGSKVLVIADRVFWLPLKGLFTLMGLSSVGLKDSEAYSYNIKDALNSEELINCKWDSLLSSSCLLLSHENVSASFPFDKFNCILEYSGSRGFSTISTISSKLAGLPCVHFLKLEVDDSHVPKGLCEGVNACVDPELSGVEILESTCTLHEDIKLKNLEHSLNYAPVGDKCIHVESKEPMENKERSNVSLSVRTLQFTEASEQLKAIPSSFPDIVVIVNTRDFGKEMLISRRSTYQKILAIEKGRAQVVEREIDLPADLILSAEMCLLWYDCKNILKKETFESDPSLCIPLCVENIAMNILTSLSFAFSTCVLIFEGERSSLGSIMESSDELYAAAASLGLDLQIFFTYSSELTDEIILSSIDCVSKSNGRMYPKMSESETLAESFLATFPSINSLSAHAILSSGGMLVEFLRWSLDARIRAVRRYHVPEESVALFSALCRYGEQEESKSGMTECSSVSSAADSGNSSPKVEPQRKKQKQFISIDVAVGEDVGGGHGALNQLIEDDLRSSRASKPYQSCIFERIPDLSNDVQRSNSSLNARLFCQPQGLDSSENSLDWSDTDKTQNLSRSTGKVVDHGRSFLDEDFSIEKNTFLKMRETEMGNDLEFANSYGPKKLFVGLNDHPDFLTTREVKHNFDIWDSTKDHNGELEEELCNDVDISLKKNMLPFDRRGKSLEKEVERYTRNTKSEEFPLNVSRQYDRTPLSKAIHSSRPPQGSPWTMEFLNKIKEKTKMHQRSLLCNNASSRLGYNDNMERFAKRKSPSILNFYRYQGGNSSNKISKQKKEMHSENSVSSSKNIMHSTALFPSSTPVDKKAKRTLTFARDGTETQSKLVWSKGNFGVLDEKML
ncbi:hypothetical protein Scep_026193 [Stephania cephalantha]|uniref:Uncharacterized protein n=1 Tax=Stephania cephalantha TaxID=152367 RepID=A0AAP0HQ48_9MAGN